ncbi:MAG: HNH endonuclease signature motif containing protein, partial [Actinomycetota bacterium]
GSVITPEAARRIACDATITEIARDGNSVLDVGRANRSIPATIRRALIARDGGCTHPGCDRPHRWCDAHHIVHWADGGPTSLDNLRLLCRQHHRMTHEGLPSRRE